MMDVLELNEWKINGSELNHSLPTNELKKVAENNNHYQIKVTPKTSRFES